LGELCLLEPEQLVEGVEEEQVEGECLDSCVLGCLETNDQQAVLHVLVGQLVAHSRGFALGRQCRQEDNCFEGLWVCPILLQLVGDVPLHIVLLHVVAGPPYLHVSGSGREKG
jgi:hypothetical protein